MKSTTKVALVAGTALALGLAVNAYSDGPGPGLGYGMGFGHMGYGMGAGHMGYGMNSGYHMGPGFGMGAGYGMGLLQGDTGTVMERLDALKSKLGITEDQRDAWQGFADNVKKQAEDRQTWFDKMHGSRADRTTPDWFAQHNAAMSQQHADIAATTTAFTKLYDVLTPEQRASIDEGTTARGRRYSAR